MTWVTVIRLQVCLCTRWDAIKISKLSFNKGAHNKSPTHLILRDVDRGAVVEAGGLVVGVVVERRLEVLGDVDDDRGRQTRDDVAATEQWKGQYLKDVYIFFSSPFRYNSHNLSVLFTFSIELLLNLSSP